MLHLPNNCRASDPKLVIKKSGIWQVDFYFYNDQGQTKRIQIKAGLNRIKDLKERRKISAELIKATIEQLKSGVNYITNTAPQEYEGELTPGTPFADALNLAVKRLDIEHATSLDIHSMLRYFTPSLKAINAASLPIGKVTRREVVLALNHATSNKSAKTFNRYRKYLMILFKYLVEIMAVDVNPVRDITIKSTVTTVKETLSHQQRKQIDRHLKAKGLHTFRLFNRIFFTSGSRITELLRLRAKDVNLEQQWYLVTIKKGKNKRQVKKTISNYAVEYWRYALRNAGKEDYLFSKGLKPGIKPITAAQLTRRWEIHVKLGLGITADFYSNRHASATQIADNYSQQIAADHLQHTSKAMVRKIYDVSAEDRRHEAAKLVRVVY